MIEKHYKKKEVADLLSCSQRTISRMIKKGVESNGQDGLAPVTRRETGIVLIPESTLSKYLERMKPCPA
jgi:predicted transcriptional regulator